MPFVKGQSGNPLGRAYKPPVNNKANKRLSRIDSMHITDGTEFVELSDSQLLFTPISFGITAINFGARRRVEESAKESQESQTSSLCYPANNKETREMPNNEDYVAPCK